MQILQSYWRRINLKVYFGFFFFNMNVTKKTNGSGKMQHYWLLSLLQTRSLPTYLLL